MLSVCFFISVFSSNYSNLFISS